MSFPCRMPLILIAILLSTSTFAACGDSGSGDSGSSKPCGNGVLQAPELCDDGNTANDDGCSEACVLELCENDTLRASSGEQCDDDITPQLSRLYDSFEDLRAATTPGQPSERAALVGVAQILTVAFHRLDAQMRDVNPITDGGLSLSRDVQIADAIRNLDALAYSLVQTVNDQHNIGRGLIDDTANDFFALETGGSVANSAGEIRLADAILTDRDNIAAGGAPGPAASGDNTNAALLARLRDALFPSYAPGDLLGAPSGVTQSVIQQSAGVETTCRCF